MNDNAELGTRPVETEVLEREIKAYTLSDKDLLIRHSIEIRFLSGRGCIIRVGCKEIAFESTKEAVGALSNYEKNPQEANAYWKEVLK